MPPIRTPTSRTTSRKAPPPGFSDLEDTLLSFSNAMKDAQTTTTSSSSDSATTLKRHESLWPIHRISHQRTRYIYDLFYTQHAISRQLYDWLLKNGYADAALIAKWKKQGYEKLCCVRCIQTKETNFSATCICRVPKAVMERGVGGGGEEGLGDAEEGKGQGDKAGGGGGGGGGKVIQCVNCGCRGCASTD